MAWVVLLVFYAALLSIAVVPVAIILGLWSWNHSRRTGVPPGRRAFFAAMLPFALIVVAGFWFAGYAVMSVARGLDPQVGTEWSVAVTDTYSLCMTGRADVGSLVKGPCGRPSVVSGIRALGQCGTTVFGVSRGEDWFVLETNTGQVTQVLGEEEALAPCPDSDALKTTFQFYRDLRMGWPDAVAFLVLAAMLPPAAWLWFRFFLSDQPKRQVA